MAADSPESVWQAAALAGLLHAQLVKEEPAWLAGPEVPARAGLLCIDGKAQAGERAGGAEIDLDGIGEVGVFVHVVAEDRDLWPYGVCPLPLDDDRVRQPDL
jgi:hypothetical protein